MEGGLLPDYKEEEISMQRWLSDLGPQAKLFSTFPHSLVCFHHPIRTCSIVQLPLSIHRFWQYSYREQREGEMPIKV